MYLRQSSATTIRVGPFLGGSGGTTPQTSLSIASGAVRLSKNGGAFALKNNASDAVHDENGWYAVGLNATDTNTAGELLLSIQTGTAVPVWRHFVIQPALTYDAVFGGGLGALARGVVSNAAVAQGGTTSSITLASGETTTNDVYNGAFLVVEYPSGVRVGNVISDYTGSTREATLRNAMPAAITSAVTYTLYAGTNDVPLAEVWNAPTSSYTAPGTFGQALAPLSSGTATNGGSSDITLAVGSAGTNDWFNNHIIALTAGRGAGQAFIISDYTGSTRQATINGTWLVTPDSTTQYVIYPLGAIPGATAPTAAQVADAVWDEARADHTIAGSFGQFTLSQLTGTSDATVANVTSVSTVNFIGSSASVQPRPGSYSNVTVSVGGIAPATYSGVTVGINNIAAGSYSGVTIAGVTRVNSSVTIADGRYSAVTVSVGTVETVDTAARASIASSVWSTNFGNNRFAQQAIFALRNRVQIGTSTFTVFGPDDTTSSWTGSLTTGSSPIAGFDPQG